MNYTEESKQIENRSNQEFLLVKNIDWKKIRNRLDYQLKTGGFNRVPQGRDVFEFIKTKILEQDGITK